MTRLELPDVDLRDLGRRTLGALEQYMPRRRPAPSYGALAAGAFALGALAIGAIAIGRLAVGRMAIRQARIGRLEVDELVVNRLRVREKIQSPGEATD